LAVDEFVSRMAIDRQTIKSIRLTVHVQAGLFTLYKYTYSTDNRIQASIRVVAAANKQSCNWLRLLSPASRNRSSPPFGRTTQSALFAFDICDKLINAKLVRLTTADCWSIGNRAAKAVIELRGQ